MILSIYQIFFYNLDMKYIVNNFIKNGDVKVENVPRWGKSKANIWVQVTISLIYYWFIVRFTIGFENSYFIDRYHIGIFERWYASMVCLSPIRFAVVIDVGVKWYTFRITVCWWLIPSAPIMEALGRLVAE